MAGQAAPYTRLTPLGAAALRLAGRGLRVFPCLERGKKPAIANNLKRATTDPNMIAGWWQSRNFNIAVATGANSGIWVLDIDGNEGEQTLRRLEAKHGALPATVEVITGDGRHLYWRWPLGFDIRNSQHNPILLGLDVRANGGYVLAPPSVHPCGRAYSWSVDSAGKFADAPDWLLDVVTAKTSVNTNSTATATPEAWRSFIKEEVEGSRRSHAIARLYGLLVRRFIDPVVALDLVRMFNTLRRRPPLADTDLARIANDIAAAELRRRSPS